jgi:hypothetical protein
MAYQPEWPQISPSGPISAQVAPYKPKWPHISSSGPTYQPEWPHISAQGLKAPRADMGPRGLIYHAIWILACIILFIIYYQAKIAIVNEGKILKYLTIDFFVVTYFFIVITGDYIARVRIYYISYIVNTNPSDIIKSPVIVMSLICIFCMRVLILISIFCTAF